MHRFIRKLATLVAATIAVFPSISSAQRIGSLISAQPVDGAPRGMRAWRIQYWTSDDRKPIRVTGMVIAPDA